MRGGLFLFPLYVDPQDAAVADAREEVHTVASQSATDAEAANPQRLATLIRSATNGSLGSSHETTEIDADVLNSMPKWAQAVVQTGCFNAGAVHSRKPSPTNRLKRRLELQGEDECELPRKRRSFGNGGGDAKPINDKSGALQDCLDELNAEPGVDVDMEEEELPTLSTRAEIAVDSVESMKELLLSEEQRLDNGIATQSMDRSKSKELQVQGDQEADASLIGNVMQAELDNILPLSLQKIPQIRKEAVACIGALLTQGLVNPLQCIRNLVALETDRVSDVRDAAFSQLLALYERFQGQFHTPLVNGIYASYSFQLNVFGNATALGIDDKKKEYCLFARLYTNCLNTAVSHEFLFLKALVNQFTDQGSVLKPFSAKVDTDSKAFTSKLKYLCYLAQIISMLPYDVEDKPLYIIYLINRYVSLRLGPTLDDLKETFAKAGIAPEELEDEEADLSKINIDEYRPLLSPPKSKLAVAQTNGCIAFAIALMLRLKFVLKRSYQLSNEKCATYKPSTADPPVEARERSPKKLLLPSVDDLCKPDDRVELSWNLFMTAWFAARKDQKHLDIDMEEQENLKSSPKRRRRSRKVAVPTQEHSSENDINEEDEYVDGFA
ncbi:Nipped-B protein [Phytophthora cinnamomi]|uniref:Nipped-B protein n=1 Tax=Phytophthora cinnamomi TaxID=4785 RepID=UPI0035594421|nr:Nipped-B protein [Phytophthora cinnamomi]